MDNVPFLKGLKTRALDDDRIRACEDFGARVCMTSGAHCSGTDRIAEATMSLGEDEQDIIVNLQG